MKKAFAVLLALAMMASASMTGCGSGEETAPAGEETEQTQETTGESETAEEGETAPETSGTAASGNTLVWNIGVDPKTLDPALNQAVDGSQVINNTFEGLLRDCYDGNGLQPAMATEVPEPVQNEDGTVTYTFHLRDAKWSDGQPVTANDFVFAWQRAVDPMTASEYAYIMSPILNADAINAGEKDKSELGVKAIDDKTLEVTLSQPCAYFLELTAFSTLMPVREDMVDVDGLWAKDPEKAVCNGPFVLSEYVMGDHLTLVKNENYWDAENVQLDAIVGKMIVDNGTTLAAFKNGEVDITDRVANEEIQQLVATGECDIMPYLANEYYTIKCNSSVEALNDVRVRKAISMALDRQAIVENVSRGGEKPAMGFVPYGFSDSQGNDFRETAGSYYLTETAQVEEAQALLAEAGYPNGEGIPQLELMYNTDDTVKAVVEAMQEMWHSNLGIDVKLSNQEWAVFITTMTTANYDALCRHGWTGDYADPQTFLDIYVSGNGNAGNGYSNPEYDELIATALASSGADRDAAFYEAEKVLMEDAYIIPVYYRVKPVLSNHERVQGWTISPLGAFWFGDVTINA